MYMFLPFLTIILGLIFAWFENRIVSLFMLGVTVIILLIWFAFHANSHLHINL